MTAQCYFATLLKIAGCRTLRALRRGFTCALQRRNTPTICGAEQVQIATDLTVVARGLQDATISRNRSHVTFRIESPEPEILTSRSDRMNRSRGRAGTAYTLLIVNSAVVHRIASVPATSTLFSSLRSHRLGPIACNRGVFLRMRQRLQNRRGFLRRRPGVLPEPRGRLRRRLLAVRARSPVSFRAFRSSVTRTPGGSRPTGQIRRPASRPRPAPFSALSQPAA